MLKNKKLFIVLFFAVLVVLVGIGILIGVEVAGSQSANPSAASGYTAVYMTSGDIYFGKLYWFPKPYIADAMYVTKGTGQNGQPQYGIAMFKSVAWAPTGDIYFNPAQVLFTAPLRNDSQIVQEIENPQAAASAASAAQAGSVPAGTSGTNGAAGTATSSLNTAPASGK